MGAEALKRNTSEEKKRREAREAPADVGERRPLNSSCSADLGFFPLINYRYTHTQELIAADLHWKRGMGESHTWDFSLKGDTDQVSRGSSCRTDSSLEALLSRRIKIAPSPGPHLKHDP